MIAITKIDMDLVRGGRTPSVKLMCEDKLSRAMQICLHADGEAFALPEDCKVLVRYSKPDGTGGSYDTLPDGSAAWSIAENQVTVMLAPQVCNVAGKVKLTVTLISGEKELNCFTVYLDVKGHGKALEESENYVYLTGYLPQPVAAKEGQYLRIAAVDACGKVTAVETAAVEAMPGYVRSEAERLAEVVQSRQSGETLTLLACADLHHSAVHSYAARMAESITHAGQAMGILRQQVHLDGAAMLGDLVWDGGETAQEALGAMRFVNGAIADGFSGLPNFRTRGNHDCVAKAEDGLTDGQIFANIGAYNTGAVYDPENRTGGYCYRDFGEQKIRVVCINTRG